MDDTFWSKDQVIKRFWSRVQKTDTCWLWTAAKGKAGYGAIKVERRKLVSTHRFSYELHFGPIPEGMQVCHDCDVRNCVRPDHLFLGTDLDNKLDMLQKGRHGAYTRPERIQRGDQHWSKRHPEYLTRRRKRRKDAMLTEDIVRQIRQNCRQGATQQSQADRFGISRGLVSSIVRLERWKHVD